jgi:hypothetical protein
MQINKSNSRILSNENKITTMSEQLQNPFAVNKRQNTKYSFLPVTSKVSCIRRKRGQIICLQGKHKSMVIFVLKRRKVVR